MKRFIVAGVDGSPESLAATRWAAEEAVRRGLPLHLVHAQTWLDDIHADPAQPREVRQLTDRMLTSAAEEIRRAHPGLEVRADLLAGQEPIHLLVTAGAEAELLVLGSRGLGGFTGLFVGSVGLGVTARCAAPVVLVRPTEASRRGTVLPEVTVGVDTRDPSDKVLDFAFRQAEQLGATLRAVHGWEPPAAWGYTGWVPPQLETAQFRAIETKLLDSAVDGLRQKYPDVGLVTECRVGSGSAALVDASADSALVVIGRRRRPHLLGPRLGPTAHAVIHHAKAPVAVIPHD